MRKLNLFSKTFLFTITLMGAIVLISHLLISFLLPSFYLKEKEKELNKLSQQLIFEVQNLQKQEMIEQVESYAKKNNLNILLEIGEESYEFESFQLEINVSNDLLGNQFIFTPELPGNSYFQTNQWENLNDEMFEQHKIERSEYTLINREVLEIPFNEKAILYLSMNIQPIEEASGIIFNLLPYSIGISLLISLIASYLYAKTLTQPIKEICDVTNKMKSLTSEARCEVKSQDEIGELANNINNLYQTLRTTIQSLEYEIKSTNEVEQQKLDFLRSASHELKTPLTRLNIMLENMIFKIGKYKDRDFYLTQCQKEVNQLSLMVKEILDTSNLQSTVLATKPQTIDLSDLILSVVEPYQLLARSKGIDMVLDLKQSFMVNLDVSSVSKALSNIISNAVNYTEANKQINIFIHSNTLVIENECTPIPESEVKKLFKAFYRPDFSRNRHNGGNGLGLYIVSQVLCINQLMYSFTPTETGMRFEVIFPQEALKKR